MNGWSRLVAIASVVFGVRDLSREIPMPWAVYQVSGEFAALEALAAQGLAPRAAPFSMATR